LPDPLELAPYPVFSTSDCPHVSLTISYSFRYSSLFG